MGHSPGRDWWNHLYCIRCLCILRFQEETDGERKSNERCTTNGSSNHGGCIFKSTPSTSGIFTSTPSASGIPATSSTLSAPVPAPVSAPVSASASASATSTASATAPASVPVLSPTSTCKLRSRPCIPAYQSITATQQREDIQLSQLKMTSVKKNGFSLVEKPVSTRKQALLPESDIQHYLFLVFCFYVKLRLF